MIVIDLISELRVFSVADPGIPNKERVLIKVDAPVNLHGLFVGLAVAYPSTGTIYPINGYTYYFPNKVASAPSWIVLYTGKGVDTDTIIPTTNELAYSLHWGEANIIFGIENVVPFVARMGSIAYEMPQQIGLIPATPKQLITGK